jgi:hypothetical protein
MALHDHDAQHDPCRYRLAADSSYKFFSVSAVVVGRFLRRHPEGIQQSIMLGELAVKRVLDNFDPP